jgi:Transmembrane secretion effector
MNLAGAGTFAIWVLWARQRLGLQGVGFGALVTAYAVGGLLGTLLASRLETALGPATLLRAGLVVEAGSQLSLALTRSPWVAGATLILFGVHAIVWGVVTVSVRQRLVPDRLRGRGRQRLLPVRPRRGVARHAAGRRARLDPRHHGAVLARVGRGGAARRGGVAPPRARRARVLPAGRPRQRLTAGERDVGSAPVVFVQDRPAAAR